jgi:hypothetical protein
MTYYYLLFSIFSFFVLNQKDDTLICDLYKRYRNTEGYIKHEQNNKESFYILSGLYPFGDTSEPKNIYAAKVDKQGNTIYEIRTINTNAVHFFNFGEQHRNVNNKFVYYINIRKDKILKSYYIGNFLIDKQTNLSDIENIYLKYKDIVSENCSTSSIHDWKKLGLNPIEIVNCK